jgi:agmatine deiminase
MLETPRMAGFRMPAEWEPQEAVWLSWPLNPDTWPDCRPQVEQAMAGFAAAITRFERVRINAPRAAHTRIGDLLAAADAVLDHVDFFDHPGNDAWCRDHGPVFVKHRDSGALAIVDFRYNAWGGKFPPWDLDDAMPARIADALKLPRFAIPLVAEGGALETNGAGVLLTTESVLLNPNRNPALTRRRVEMLLREALGMDRIWWLPSGLAGDDTDGHIDTLTRFCTPDALLTVVEDDINSPNHLVLKRNAAKLARFHLPDGRRPVIIPLPLPDPIRPQNWREEVLPGTYANFLVINGAVIVPTYRQPANDRAALRRIADCFPGRETIGVDCCDILLEGGALHCLSQQQPSGMRAL